MGPQAGGGDVRLGTGGADKRPLVVVQPLVQLEVDVLGEARRTLVTVVGLLATVQSRVRLQVGAGGKSFATVFTGERLLAGVHEQVFLEVGQLGEVLGTFFALERSDTRVCTKVHF